MLLIFLAFFCAVVVVLVVDVNQISFGFFLHRGEDQGPKNETISSDPPVTMILLGFWRFFGGG